MSNYQSMKISEAMNNITSHKFLLPAIQRGFVWEQNQIEKLFDSLLRGYPINSFMLWKINNANIKNSYRFYEFINKYVQHFGDTNRQVPVNLLTEEFFAVIDGQQRLTSLYIGLSGSYKTKKPNKWWKDTEALTDMDDRQLYLELTELLSLSIDNEQIYNFKFLSDQELQNDMILNKSHFWFKVSEILNFSDLASLNKFLLANNLVSNDVAVKLLTNLFSVIKQSDVINYYCIDDQDLDRVLEIFIRTNRGGTQLSFSDLLMSISSANWSIYDARDEIKETKDIIYTFGNPNFMVDQDFILKTILVLSIQDVRFKISNFDQSNVALFERNWDRIKKCLITTFCLLEKLNFNDTVLRSKNAVIPIVYYIYKNKLEDKILKSTYDSNDKQNISKWLSMSLLKGIFGGQSDSILKSIRDIIDKSSSSTFPIQDIINEFRTNSKNYNFDEESIKSFLRYQWGSAICGVVLNLLYPNVVLINGKNVAQDHMHPKTMFEGKNKLASLSLTATELAFYKNKENYNSCLNLQLLETLENNSKGDEALLDWARRKKKTKNDLLVKGSTSLDIKDFKDFIQDREEILVSKLKGLLII